MRMKCFVSIDYLFAYLFVLLLLLLLPISFAATKEIVKDAALSIILNDTIYADTTYTKLFKISNKHPSLGILENLRVDYSVKKQGLPVFEDSFTKTVNRYTTADTGNLHLDVPGDYILCGKILFEDFDNSNNVACKNIHVIETKGELKEKSTETIGLTKSELDHMQKENAEPIHIYNPKWQKNRYSVVLRFADEGEYNISFSNGFETKEESIAVKRAGNRTIYFGGLECIEDVSVYVDTGGVFFQIDCPKQEDKNSFALNISQLENGTVYIYPLSNKPVTFKLTFLKGKNKVYTSGDLDSSDKAILIPYLPAKDGLYSVNANIYWKTKEEKKSYSVFFHTQQKNNVLGKEQAIESDNDGGNDVQSPLTGFAIGEPGNKSANSKIPSISIFILLFLPLFLLAAYIVLKE